MGNACSTIPTPSSSNCFGSAKRYKAPEIPEELIGALLKTKRFNYKELCKATDNFTLDNKIGAGGFGNIYKGILKDGTLAALKVLSPDSRQGPREFISEISALANVVHGNLVELLGFCVEGQQRILVFEYLKNRSLLQTLFSEGSRVVGWSWPMRRRVCIGVAKGLCFLHEHAEIVHSDIKPGNILLDDDFVPKICDFGLARRFSSDVSHLTTSVRGTYGYLAPEYMYTGKLTKRVDVYSFGILVLEIVSRKHMVKVIGPAIQQLLEIAWELHEKGKLMELVDESMELVDESMDPGLDVKEACRYLDIGLLCTQRNPELRPTISTVLEMLRGKCEVNTSNMSRSDYPFPDITPHRNKYDRTTTMTFSDSASAILEMSGPLNDLGEKDLLSPGNPKEVETASLLTSYTYKEVKIITRDFSQKISSADGDESIYFGFISKELRQEVGPLQVAVKIYDGAKCYKEKKTEFQTQVDLLKRISHPNLVKMIGHCFKKEHLILIHEIMARGSLADNLYSGEWSSLSWLVRIKIALDAARGLAYLHENVISIIHGDFRPANILIDMDYNAKVFNFGLEVSRPKDYGSKVAATSLGTSGYATHGYSSEGRVSMKSDVYSFGVFLVELLSGRRWTQNDLVDWAQHFSRENNVRETMDARLRGQYPIQAAEEVAILAWKCLDDNPQQRPSMGDIVDSLKFLLEAGNIPTIKEDAGIALEGSPTLPSTSNTIELQNQLGRNTESTGEIALFDLDIQPQDQGVILMLKSLGLTEAPKPEEWLNAREIYLMDNLLSNLPESPRCPILSVLSLEGNCKLRMIPTTFFEFMPMLQVLNLSRTRLKSLPDSLFQLYNLKSLSLRDCDLFTMLCPKVGQLHQLEVLDLKGTEIANLPKEIRNLTNLKCLKVSFYGDFSPELRQSKPEKLIPQGTISALSQLGELCIDVNPEDERWEEAIVKDVCGLTSLHTLKLYFPTVTYLSYFKRPLPLCFRFIVGRHYNRIMSRLPHELELELERWDRCLRYVNGDIVPVDIQRILSQSTSFYLDRHKTVTKLSSFGIVNMKQLKHCIVGECNAIEYLIDGRDRILKSLESLHIFYLKNLRGISPNGPVRTGCLGNLRSLTLQTCPELIGVFTPELLKNLINLEELTVEDCENATSLVRCQDSSKYEGSCFVPKLKRLSLHYLPELSSIANGLHIAPELELLSFCDCPNLMTLSAMEVGSKHLRKIEGEMNWWEEVEWLGGRPIWFNDIFYSIDIVEKG